MRRRAGSLLNTGPSKSTTKPTLAIGLARVAMAAPGLRRPTLAAAASRSSFCHSSRYSQVDSGCSRRGESCRAPSRRRCCRWSRRAWESAPARRARAPQLPRGSTHTLGPHLVARLEVLVTGERAVALHAGRSRAGLVSANEVTSRRLGLTSGRQIHSPVPDWIEQPVGVVHLGPIVLAVGGAGSRRRGTCWSAAQCRASSPCSRRKMRACTSITVSAPGRSTKR